jgi:hypothetical protein
MQRPPKPKPRPKSDEPTVSDKAHADRTPALRRDRSFWVDVDQIITGVAAIGALWISIYTFRATTDAQGTLTANQTYQAYLQTVMDKDRSALFGVERGTVAASYIMATAESLFLLTRRDSGWEETVRNMLRSHKDLLSTQGFNCGTFDAKFLRLANEVVGVMCEGR